MLASLKKLYQDESSFRAMILLSIFLVIGIFVLAQISSILWPFIGAILLAALLNPWIRKLQRIGVSRSLGAVVLLSLLILAFFIIGLVTSFFVQKYFVLYLHNIRNTAVFVADWIPRTLTTLAEKMHVPFEINAMRIREYVISSLGNMTDVLLRYVFSLFDTAKSVVGMFSFLFFVPILTFYLLKDWPKFAAKTKEYSPKAIVEFTSVAFPKARKALALQVLGQAKVASLLMVFYAVCLWAISIKPFILLGFMSGVATFIPFLGIFIAFIITFLAALGQGLGLWHLFLVAVLYFVGSSIESNFLTPNIVGNKIGIHPVWIFFAVFATLAVFGLSGAFFIMPIATTVWSLIHSGVQWLREKDIEESEAESSANISE